MGFVYFSSEPQAVGDESVEQPGNSDITEERSSAGRPNTEDSPATGTNNEQTDKVEGTTTATTKTTKPSEVTISAADLQLSMARPPGSAQPAVKTS